MSSKSFCTTGLAEPRPVLGATGWTTESPALGSVIYSSQRSGPASVLRPWGGGSTSRTWVSIILIVIPHHGRSCQGLKQLPASRSINLPLAYWANHSSLTEVILITRPELQKGGSEGNTWLWSVFNQRARNSPFPGAKVLMMATAPPPAPHSVLSHPLRWTIHTEASDVLKLAELLCLHSTSYTMFIYCWEGVKTLGHAIKFYFLWSVAVYLFPPASVVGTSYASNSHSL